MVSDVVLRQKIEKLVQKSGLSRLKFADKIGFNKANFNLILNGDRKVPDGLLVAILFSRVASVEYFLGDTEKKLVIKKFSDISSGGNTTINNGESEKQSKRADAITNKMLDMLAMGINNINDIQARISSMGQADCVNLSKIENRLDERNKLADRLISMLESKDAQIKEKDGQISKLMTLLENSKKG